MQFWRRLRHIFVRQEETAKLYGEWLFYLDGKLVKREKNLLVQAGLNFLAAILANQRTNDVPVHCLLGTGTTAPAATDTKLQNEVLRKAVSAKQVQANLIRFRTFWLANEANGTWTEFGLAFAGTDQKDSGVLFSRLVPTGGLSKTSNTVLTIETRITMSAG